MNNVTVASTATRSSQAELSSTGRNEDLFCDALGALPPVINSVLCFVMAKRGSLPAKEMKEQLISFFSNDLICSAKETLTQIASRLNLDDAPKMKSRRFSKENPLQKIVADVEDLWTFITYIDENNVESLLPQFVADKPDSMPSIRLVEGDLACIMHKLQHLEDKVSTLQETVDSLMRVSVATREEVGKVHVSLPHNNCPTLPSNNSFWHAPMGGASNIARPPPIHSLAFCYPNDGIRRRSHGRLGK